MWRVLHINWICICAFILIFLLLIFLYCRHRRHKKARCRVKARCDREKLADINQALEPYGFAYDLKQDIFYSLEDAWQRNFGYGKIYDEAAPIMNMIIDCEPIYFQYDNRRWMIELWKGQYGITTGAEVGIYVDNKPNPREKPEDVFYECVSEEEQLPICMTLYKNGKALFQREKNHWWLTGFRLGEFSYPRELMLEVSLVFERHDMLEAFLKGCYEAGYRPEDMHVRCNRVSFSFYHPKNYQPCRYGKIFRKWIQWQNRLNCRIYRKVTRAFSRTIDKLDYLMLAYPRIFCLLIQTGRFVQGKKRK